ncbi:hypothetical protein [Deinococcus ruber]|uniref:DUF3299 domain-containing protein n=1 Tax=Deinococcus ruber TaxID=1848197 RepID=A0A918C1T1_9DEIO|nr:hypothetical protein [Deinococcus ruber]GGR00385.1 hypothetical protein GCM10008957_11470 [Deinococcus ruber]
MNRLLLFAALALSACAPATTQQASSPPVTAPAPSVPVVSVPVQTAAPLTVLDVSAVTVTLDESELTIRLNPDVPGIWLRIVLPDGSISPVTVSPYCGCLGLSAQLPSLILTFLPGLSIQTAPTLDGPWTVAATTQ